MPDELDDLDRQTEQLQPEDPRPRIYLVTDQDSYRYAGIALASIRRSRSTWTELDGQTAAELWKRLCRRARTHGSLSDEAARVHCHQAFRFARADARRVVVGRSRPFPPFDEPRSTRPDPQREWVIAHLHLLTPRQRQLVELALNGFSFQEIETYLCLRDGGAWPLMNRAQKTLNREWKKGHRDG